MRDVLKQDAFLLLHHFVFRIPLYYGKYRVSDALAELAGRSNALAKLTNISPSARCRNATPSNAAISASIPFWTSLRAIFPLASSMDTASGINGQQHLSRMERTSITSM